MHMIGLPGGQESGYSEGAAGWWLQRSDAPAHANAAPKRYLSGSSLHSDTVNHTRMLTNKIVGDNCIL